MDLKAEIQKLEPHFASVRQYVKKRKSVSANTCFVEWHENGCEFGSEEPWEDSYIDLVVHEKDEEAIAQTRILTLSQYLVNMHILIKISPNPGKSPIYWDTEAAASAPSKAYQIAKQLNYPLEFGAVYETVRLND